VPCALCDLADSTFSILSRHSSPLGVTVVSLIRVPTCAIFSHPVRLCRDLALPDKVLPKTLTRAVKARLDDDSSAASLQDKLVAFLTELGKERLAPADFISKVWL